MCATLKQRNLSVSILSTLTNMRRDNFLCLCCGMSEQVISVKIWAIAFLRDAQKVKHCHFRWMREWWLEIPQSMRTMWKMSEVLVSPPWLVLGWESTGDGSGGSLAQLFPLNSNLFFFKFCGVKKNDLDCAGTTARAVIDAAVLWGNWQSRWQQRWSPGE